MKKFLAGLLSRLFISALAFMGYFAFVRYGYVREEIERKLPDGDHYECEYEKKALQTWGDLKDKISPSDDGYLITDKHIPIRAIARRPNVMQYDSANSAATQVVNSDKNRGIMKTWHPYYIFKMDWERNSILTGETPFTKENDRSWVRMEACFCWTTRECINIGHKDDLLEGVPMFTTLEEAKEGKNIVDSKYKYVFEEHFIKAKDKDSVKRPFEIAALPLLDRKEGVYWLFVRPEGGKEGYEALWLKWDGKDKSVQLRFRVTRIELERYTKGLLNLLTEYTREHKNPEKKVKITTKIYDLGSKDLIMHEESGTATLGVIEARIKGVPKLTGYLQNPMESEIEFEGVRTRALKLLEISNCDDAWINEVTYCDIDAMP